ncbi:MAG: DUF4199 domain-containing protein [Bernardetiaceae bacterium]
MKKVVLFGLLGGVLLGGLLSASSYAVHLAGQNPVGALEFSFLWPLYLVVMGGTLFYFRNYHNKGELYTGPALLMALLINLIGAGLYALYVYGLFSSSPETLTLWQEQMIAVWERTAEGMAAPDIEGGTAALRQTPPSKIATDKLLKVSVMGLFFTLVIGFAFRRRTQARNQR